MSYSTETDMKTCEACGTENAVLIEYAGDYRANQERERADCYKCGAPLVSEKCLMVHTGSSIEAVKQKLNDIRAKLPKR